jgi:hypothetical protein
MRREPSLRCVGDRRRTGKGVSEGTEHVRARQRCQRLYCNQTSRKSERNIALSLVWHWITMSVDQVVYLEKFVDCTCSWLG